MASHMDARYWSEQLAEALRAELEANEAAALGGSGSGGGGEDGQAAGAAAIGVVGLDLEWKPAFVSGARERKASVLQVSGPGLCLVIQLMKLNGQLPKRLNRILKNPRLLKVGGCNGLWMGCGGTLGGLSVM